MEAKQHESPPLCPSTDESVSQLEEILCQIDLHEEEINAYNKNTLDQKCDICVANNKLKHKNIIINNLWMIWEYLVTISDFVTDFYIICLYLTDKTTFYDGITLVAVLIISTIFQAYQSHIYSHPWYVWLRFGGIYETYRSWGCEIPTVAWDEFRYIHCVAESLPQTIVQSIIMIKNVPDHDYSHVPVISIVSVLMSVFSLSYVLAEEATTVTGQLSRKYFGEVILENPFSEEAVFRISVLIFFYTDTLLRVLALSLFVNVESFAPFSWIIVGFLFPIYMLYQWSDHTFIESMIEGFVSIFANDALLEIGKEQGHTSKRLQQMMFNVVVILTFLMSSLFMINKGENIVFWVSITLLIINLITMVPAIWYMYFREELTQKWSKPITKTNDCNCNITS